MCKYSRKHNTRKILLKRDGFVTKNILNLGCQILVHLNTPCAIGKNLRKQLI